jgi:hypothetical protein
MYTIIWPERKTVTAEQLIMWAKDDVCNGDTDIFTDPASVITVEDAITVLNDSGSVTFGK